MKKLLIIICLCFCQLYNLRAQTWSEWFSQKKTQKKYLLQQIAALQVYLGYLQKGYSIAQSGLHTISDIKHGDLNLHTGYFNSLQSVNPGVKGYARIAEIVAMQTKILKTYKALKNKIHQSGQFGNGDVDYINKVFDSLLDGCEGTLDELITVTTPGRLEMKDDERIRRIDALYNDMQDKYSFAMAFDSQVTLLSLQRSREARDVNTIQSWNNLK